MTGIELKDLHAEKLALFPSAEYLIFAVYCTPTVRGPGKQNRQILRRSSDGSSEKCVKVVAPVFSMENFGLDGR